MGRAKYCLEEIVKYSITPIFLLETSAAILGIYLGAKYIKAKYPEKLKESDIEKINFIYILKDVYKGRKELYFPKKSN